MAKQNSKNKTNNQKRNTNGKNNTSNNVNASKNTNNTKKVEKVNDVKKKEVKKETPREEVKVEKNIAEEVVTTEVVKEKKSFKLTSKQRDIILILLVTVVLVIAFVLTGTKEPKLDIELPIALEGETGFTEITYSQYEEKLNTEAPFLVVIKRDGCSYCEMYDPVVTKVANEYGLPFYYINLSNLTAEERTALNNSNPYLKKEQWGTPTTLFMYGDTVVDSIGGYVEEETFVKFVKENFVVEDNE